MQRVTDKLPYFNSKDFVKLVLKMEWEEQYPAIKPNLLM